MAYSILVRLLALALAAGLLLLVACGREVESPATQGGLSALPLSAPTPADNPGTPAKLALGRALFWDPVLSAGRGVSCASCHHPASGYADALDLAVGVNGQGLGSARHFRAPNTIPFGRRNTPTLLNVAFNGIAADGTCWPAAAPMFWDERTVSLESQALRPLSTLEEMRGPTWTKAVALDSIVARLRGIAEYALLFKAAFGENAAIDSINLGRALACFERSLTNADTPFDQYLRGDKDALSAEQQRGLTAFVQSGCAKCHTGPMLSDYQTHVLGVVDNEKNAVSDAGQRGSYAFRTASLRNLAFTAPYMHSGKLANLPAVLRFYDPGPGGGPVLNAHVSRRQRDSLLPTRVDNQDAIIAFLGALSSNGFDKTVPVRVPSGLPVGGNL